jgi:N-ethylmaleimide reductase
MVRERLPAGAQALIRETFDGTPLLCCGYDAVNANRVPEERAADLISSDAPILHHANFSRRFTRNAPSPLPIYQPLKSGVEKGYTDYPVLNEQARN